MIIQTVKFRSALSEDEARRVMEERAPQYRALAGLLQKYYVREPATGEFAGIYVWDSMESLQSFRDSDLAQTISSAYQVIGQPRIETFDVLFPLRAATAAPA